MDLSNVPLEVLELILCHLTDPVSQRRLAQVRSNIRHKVLHRAVSNKSPHLGFSKLQKKRVNGVVENGSFSH